MINGQSVLDMLDKAEARLFILVVRDRNSDTKKQRKRLTQKLQE